MRSKAEQARLDAWCQSQVPQNDSEAQIPQFGAYWPHELPTNRISFKTDGWQDQVRRKFQRWK